MGNFLRTTAMTEQHDFGGAQLWSRPDAEDAHLDQ
jgi:hypothetical protein